MIPYFQALFIQRHGMISALMIYGRDLLFIIYTIFQEGDISAKAQPVHPHCITSVCTAPKHKTKANEEHTRSI